MTLGYRAVGPLDRIPLRGGRRVETDRGPVAIFRTSDGRLFAVDDRCPHQGGPLSDGLVHGTTVTCPLHDTEVCLISGRACGPGEGMVVRHAVTVRDGLVYLAISHELFLGGPAGDS